MRTFDKRYRVTVDIIRGDTPSKALRRMWNGTVCIYDTLAEAETAIESYMADASCVLCYESGMVYGVWNILDLETAAVEKSGIIASECPAE